MADESVSKDDPSKIARWSRRKQETREDGEAPAESEAQEAPPSLDGEQENKEQTDVVAALPPIDGLTADSDFTPFLDRAVPAELRRLAMRKLWLSDPIFGHLDGLNDYDDDFRTLGVGKVVRTAYQVGKGMVTRAEAVSEGAEHSSPTNEAGHEIDEPDDKPELAQTSIDGDETDIADGT